MRISFDRQMVGFDSQPEYPFRGARIIALRDFGLSRVRSGREGRPTKQ